MTSRAKLTYDERVLIEDSLKNGIKKEKLCEELGINSNQLRIEIRRGWISSENRYSAEKAQFSLR